MSEVTITAFDWVPSFAQGQVRDLRVRWMLEEIGESYRVRYLSQGEQKQPAHSERTPYGQVPTLEEGNLTLFESGAIVLHLAQTRDKLLPADPAGRGKALEWLFAALNTVEPPLMDLSFVNIFEFDKPWSEPRRPGVEDRIAQRLKETAERLGRREWFHGAFSVGDLMMISVLRILDGEPLLAAQPALVDYVARGTARPAFRKALADQMAGFTGSAPPQFEQWLAQWQAANAKRKAEA